jgi:hypothetical protein
MVSPRIIKVTTIALAAAAIAAPAASARPARITPHQGIAAISVSQQQQLAAGSAFASHPHSVSAALPAAGLSAPTAYTRQDKQVAPSSSSPTVVGTAPPARAGSANGFDWGDAGIGAGGALAISIVGIGGAFVLSQRRTRRTRTSAVATG